MTPGEDGALAVRADGRARPDWVEHHSNQIGNGGGSHNKGGTGGPGHNPGGRAVRSARGAFPRTLGAKEA